MAFSLNLQWQADNANVLLDAGYDQWVVEKETATGSGIWNAIAPIHVQPPITRNMTIYIFNASSSSLTDLGSFRARAYNTTDALYDATPIAIEAALRGYATIEDVRDQGYDISVYSDAKVQAAIGKATSFIEKICRQWFEPRFKRVVVDAEKIDQLWLKVPIIAIQEARIDEEVLDLDEFEIYNRHLTHGIVNPDDRANPRVAWGDGREPIDVRRLYGGGRFPKARKSVTFLGVFGYTDIGEDDFVGETAEGSQIPIAYGKTPDPIRFVATKLAIRYMLPFEDAEAMTKASKVISEKTRDQSYTLATPSESEASYGFTGDTELDVILGMYLAPFDIGVV